MRSLDVSIMDREIHTRQSFQQQCSVKKAAGRMSTRTFVPRLLKSVSHYQWSWDPELFNLKAQEVRENYKQFLKVERQPKI